MTTLTNMYKGKTNSPKTKLSAAISSTDTTISVADAAVFPAAPNIAVMGDGDDAETILYSGKATGILSGATRGFEGVAKSWVIDTPIARNWTNKDFGTLIDNVNALNTGKLESGAADPAGTAAAAVSAHNTDGGAHAGTFDAAGTATNAVAAHNTASSPHSGKFDAANTAAAAVTAHDADGGAHEALLADYLLVSEKGAANGLAPLGSDSKIPSGFLPSAGGGNIKQEHYATPGTFTFTASKAGNYLVEMVGGGGTTTYWGAAGGYVRKTVTLTAGQAVTVTVGAKGGASSFGSYATAGGASGATGGVATTGDFNIPGAEGRTNNNVFQFPTSTLLSSFGQTAATGFGSGSYYNSALTVPATGGCVIITWIE